MELGRPNLEEFAATLLELGRSDPDLVVLTSDSRGSGKLGRFAAALPGQIVEVGIAEQNIVAIAAGMTGAGKKAFVVSPASFLTARALEQIKNDVAYSDFPVKLVGISAGVSYGALGSTHHSLHDIAALRAIHNIDIVIPADNFETREAIKASLTYPHPVYIRFGKKPMYHLPRSSDEFSIGKAAVLSAGTDATFVATGETVSCAVQASNQLRSEGVSCGVISIHTVKPLDEQAVLAAARSSKAIITIEEHSVCGGLGEACASLLLKHGVHVPFTIVGMPDEYLITGSQSDIFEHYGITPEGLSARVRELLGMQIRMVP